MPNDFMQTPLMPQSWIQGTQDKLTQPHLDQSPAMARLKGFGAGALSGIRDLTQPSSIVALASLLGPGMTKGMGMGEPPAISAGPLQGLARAVPGQPGEASTYTGPVQETLGEIDPAMTPVGGEGMFNAAR